jgi:hypothetical protein
MAPLLSTISHVIGTTLASRSMAGATMRTGGCGSGVGVGDGVGDGVTVGVGDGGGSVAVWLAVGVTSPADALIAGSAVAGVAVGVGLGVDVGVDVGGGSVGVCVARRTGEVTARTTAPASPISGGGGALTRIQMPQPRPARIISPPATSMIRERIGTSLFMGPILS